MALTGRLRRNGWGLLLGAGLLAGGLVAADRAGGRREEAAARRNAELDCFREAAAARLAAKERLSAAVLEGRLTLLEAAARFRALNQTRCDPCWASWQSPFPGRSDEEHVCREVISWVGGQARQHDPCLGAVTCARLEEELEALLRQGPLRLPDLPEPAAVKACGVEE
jgi:hypothetical protein